MRLTKALAAVAVVWLGAGGAAEAADDAAYSAFTVRNTSRVAIPYQVRWGADGEWRSFTLAPGGERTHFCRLDEDGLAPAAFIRFDCIAGDDDITWRTLRLACYAVRRGERGKNYAFRYANNGRYLSLYTEPDRPDQ
jgi:hypothetical protein